MDFPRHLHKDGGLYVVVENVEQYEAVKANGWADQPNAHVEQPVEVRYIDAIASSAEPSDDAPADAPKKRGRKAKD